MKNVLYALIIFLAFVLLAVFYDSMSEDAGASGGTGGSGGPAGSVVFSTSKDRSITSSSNAMNDGGNSFTIEMFYKADDANLDPSTILFSFYGILNTTDDIIIRALLFLNRQNQRELHLYVKNQIPFVYLIPIENRTSWNHIAFVYSPGFNNSLYFNGKKIYTNIFNINVIYSTRPILELGYCRSLTNGYFVGNIANVRFSGKAQYTENFSIPSVPLSATDTATFLQFKSQAGLLTDDCDYTYTPNSVQQQGAFLPMTVQDVVISF